MKRIRIHIHVSEPWTFERENGGSAELEGWAADHLGDDAEDWIVHLDRPFTIDEERFEQVRISPRYFGERLQRIEDRLVNVAANLVPCGRRWHDMEERPLAMVGIVVQGREREQAAQDG